MSLPVQEKGIFLDNPVIAWCISGLIIYSTICSSIETLPDLSTATIDFLRFSEIIVVVLFTVEYFTRIILSKQKLKYVFSFYGVIDLLAILPFYLSFAVDLRSIRLLRLFRIFRILKIVRYNRAIKRFSQALYLVKEELVIFTLTSLLIIYFAAVGIYHFEHNAQPEVYKSVFDCLWWAVATLTTVGYGDIYPVTIGGRIFTFIVLMTGLGLVAVPTGIVASALSAVRNQQETSAK